MKKALIFLLALMPFAGYAQQDTVISATVIRQAPQAVTNANRNDVSRNKEGWRLEFPRFYSGDDKTFEVTKSTADYGITYSLEWDGTLKANRWTCYELYKGNMEQNVGRKDAFKEDPDIPQEYRTTLADYKGSGYSRGHLCPSADRLCSQEQNSQTFYLTNMQPQIQAHNGGVWATLEDKVRNTWASQCDTLYVVKAATIDKDHIQTYTTSGLIVPAYFYMALLAYTKSTDTYQALGVWSPHEGGSTTEYITVDDLESRTGIDFFCNLPDDLEDRLEASADGSFWGVTISGAGVVTAPVISGTSPFTGSTTVTITAGAGTTVRYTTDGTTPTTGSTQIRNGHR